MTALEDARNALAEWGEHLADAPSQSRADRMAAALRALIAEHEHLTAEMHQRELHHFETEKLLTEAGIDPDATLPTDEWEYGIRPEDDDVPLGISPMPLDAARIRANNIRGGWGIVRRRKAGPWEPVEAARETA